MVTQYNRELHVKPQHLLTHPVSILWYNICLEALII